MNESGGSGPALEARALAKTYRQGSAPVEELREVDLRVGRGDRELLVCAELRDAAAHFGLLEPQAGVLRARVFGRDPQPRFLFSFFSWFFSNYGLSKSKKSG